MSFSKMLEILQEKDKEKIVLIKLGLFYIATGRDAVLLHTKFNLKVTCFKNNMCKVGIPINSLDKYIEKLNKIKMFLKDNLKLDLNKKTQIFKSKQGVNFCGYKINEYRLKIRDRREKKIKEKSKKIKRRNKTRKYE